MAIAVPRIPEMPKGFAIGRNGASIAPGRTMSLTRRSATARASRAATGRHRRDARCPSGNTSNAKPRKGASASLGNAPAAAAPGIASDLAFRP